MRCHCGKRIWGDYAMCFEHMETAVLKVDPKYLDAGKLRKVGPLSKKNVDGVEDGVPVRFKWGHRPVGGPQQE